jgi:hypothetical protein
MKRYNYLILFIVLQSSIAIGQIGIGTKTPDDSSILDIDSKSKGLLLPRMRTSERDRIVSPANGLLLFNSISQKIEINIGTKTNPIWVAVGNTGNSDTSIQNLTSGAIFIGDNQGVANQVVMSGEATINNVGLIKMNNNAVISKTLTGYSATTGIINDTDTLLHAIEKLDGNQLTKPITSVIDNYTVLLSDFTLLCNAELKSFTLSFPDAGICPGKIYIITKIDETYNELNFSPAIQLSTTNTISKLNYLKFFKIQSNGLAWHIIN